jgi:hypothetical protein
MEKINLARPSSWLAQRLYSWARAFAHRRTEHCLEQCPAADSNEDRGSIRAADSRSLRFWHRRPALPHSHENRNFKQRDREELPAAWPSSRCAVRGLKTGGTIDPLADPSFIQLSMRAGGPRKSATSVYKAARAGAPRLAKRVSQSKASGPELEGHGKLRGVLRTSRRGTPAEGFFGIMGSTAGSVLIEALALAAMLMLMITAMARENPLLAQLLASLTQEPWI